LQARGLVRGQIAEKEAGGTGNRECNQDAQTGDRNAKISREERLNGDRNGNADQNTQDRAASADQEGFDQRRLGDFGVCGTSGHANARFAGTLGIM